MKRYFLIAVISVFVFSLPAIEKCLITKYNCGQVKERSEDTLKKYSPKKGDTLYIEQRTIADLRFKTVFVYYKCADSGGVKCHNDFGYGKTAFYSLEQKQTNGWEERTGFSDLTILDEENFQSYYLRRDSFEISSPKNFGTYRIKILIKQKAKCGQIERPEFPLIFEEELLYWYSPEFIYAR